MHTLLAAGSDYSEVLQLLIFHIGGNTTQCFNVEIIDDVSAETDETFRLSLATESVAVVAYSEAQLTIVDNESKSNIMTVYITC